MKAFTNKKFYWALIGTFIALWLVVAFVSTLHAITFFQLTNTLAMAILLGAAYEVGQASVLFSILMTKNKDKFLPWALMILLTGLQVTANVYASFKYMVNSESTDWTYWQKSILIGVQAQNAEMYQIIISWIAGALLPIVALGMTALVAQNIRMMGEENEEIEKSGSISDEEVEEIINNEVEKRVDNALKTNVSDINFKKVDEKLHRLLDDESWELIGNIPNYNEDASLKLPEIDKADNMPVEKAFDEPKSEETIVAKSEVITEPPKKRGRPPKSKEIVAETKKEQELLPKEDVRVPKIKVRTVNPLKLKDKKIKPIKRLEDLIKPSKGEEVIELIEKIENEKIKESIISSKKDDEIDRQSILVPPEILEPYTETGVEVIEAKAVQKPNVKKN